MSHVLRKLLRLCLLVAAVCALPLSSVSDAALPQSANDPPLEFIVKQLTEQNARRAADLQGYSGTRSYRVEYRGILGNRDAEMLVGVTYRAPGQKEFVIKSHSGSKFIFNHVFKPLLENESHAGVAASRQSLELTDKNYTFKFVAVEETEAGRSYILLVGPKTDCRLCFRGKIWVDAVDFAVRRMEGEPAQNPSFWIQRTEIVQQYAKVGNFWLPAENRSKSWIRLGGSATLSIKYTDYHIATGLQPTAPAAID